MTFLHVTFFCLPFDLIPRGNEWEFLTSFVSVYGGTEKQQKKETNKSDISFVIRRPPFNWKNIQSWNWLHKYPISMFINFFLSFLFHWKLLSSCNLFLMRIFPQMYIHTYIKMQKVIIKSKKTEKGPQAKDRVNLLTKNIS